MPYPPGSRLGIAFGILAVAALLAVMLYSIRRALVRVRSLGAARAYLRVHLWGGAAFMLLLLLHAGAGLPRGPLPRVLWMFSVWVVGTGALGLVLQRWLPKMLARTGVEAHFRRIPALSAELSERAQAVAAESEPRIRAYYERVVAPVMAPVSAVDVLRARARSATPPSTEASRLRRTLSAAGAQALAELEELAAAKRGLDSSLALQGVLRAWLVLHLPAAIVLLALVVLHVFYVVYF